MSARSDPRSRTTLAPTRMATSTSDSCGFLFLDKPMGVTSQKALSPLKRLLGQKRLGHAGTLDPLATGLLVVAAGKATRLLSEVEAADKEYLVAMRAGLRTDTLDTDGRILSEDPASWEGVDLPSLARPFLGEIDQVPPAYSAILVDGVRSYDRARKGQEVDLPARRVRIESIEVVPDGSCLDGSGRREGDLVLRVRCSKGTYVRSLVRDLGEAAGFGATVSALRRTAIGRWTLPDAPVVQEMPPDLSAPEDVFPLWPRFVAGPADLARLANGNDIPVDLPDSGKVFAMSSEGISLAYGRVREGRFFADALLRDRILPDQTLAKAAS